SAANTLKDTCGNNVVSEKTCKRWFSCFEKDEFGLKDEPRAGCSRKLKSEQLQFAIDENPTCIVRELSKTFHVSCHTIIYRKMKKLGWEGFQAWQMSPLLHTTCQKSTSNSV
ncbi:unnamed protein product, partial [Hymenolepis diminuta]